MSKQRNSRMKIVAILLALFLVPGITFGCSESTQHLNVTIGDRMPDTCKDESASDCEGSRIINPAIPAAENPYQSLETATISNNDIGFLQPRYFHQTPQRFVFSDIGQLESLFDHKTSLLFYD